MRVIGVREPGGEEERALKKLADDTADRKVNLIALPFDENRDELRQSQYFTDAVVARRLRSYGLGGNCW
jgi:hypothetical protein